MKTVYDDRGVAYDLDDAEADARVARYGFSNSWPPAAQEKPADEDAPVQDALAPIDFGADR